MKKKLVNIFLALLSILLLSACRSNKTETSQKASSQAKSEQTEKKTEKQSTSSSSSEAVTEAETSDEAASTDVSQKDLNIDEINNGNFQSLVGTWKNGRGDTLEITSDGTVNGKMTLQGIKDSANRNGIPYASLRAGNNTGAALALFKIGFKNPQGDQSDSSKPRILITQSDGNYPAEDYYYRQ
ncbi:DUF6287 domain-containing protein [Streptococcus devriesei]|uniref:DUF6287 domain-containing protein n=1 Tax=Streptococcus devriesei TaxID=231233 RepID=UPI00040481B1|nr:DUF6287 domain-containing protein [Streptococcus devriesei]